MIHVIHVTHIMHVRKVIRVMYSAQIFDVALTITHKRRMKRRQIFGEGKYLVHGGEKERMRKRRNHLQKENY